ncbi:hypothetical protein NKH47_25620 [Mesorhizobium sp. M1060]|uniref:hypothetical protein n=1 Tax=unclassified Mesorhizobium TaxID=325217 RepID=UPI00333A80B0
MITSKSRPLAIAAIPILRVSARVVLEKGRGWSAIDELVLWAFSIKARSATQMASELNLPRRVILEIVYRMMRFRLIEAVLLHGVPAFQATAYGSAIVLHGEEIPTLQRRFSRKIAFVVDKITGTVFPKRDVRVENAGALTAFKESGAAVHEIEVRGQKIQTSPSQNVARFQEILNPDETLIYFDGDTLIERDDEYIIVTADGHDLRGLPAKAPTQLKSQVVYALSLPVSGKKVVMNSLISKDDEPIVPLMARIDFDPRTDLIVGGQEHRDAFHAILATASRRIYLHSSFLKKDSFDNVVDLLRGAVRRGARIDIFWGAGSPNEPKEKTLLEATAISKAISGDDSLRGSVTIHLRSTGSHAKLIVADDGLGGWIGAIGSCSWLFSKFDRLEVTAILRSPGVVAQLVSSFCKLIAQPGFRPEVGSELYLLGNALRHQPQQGKMTAGVVSGQMHEALLRHASGTAEKRFLIASDRLGNAAFANAIIPSEHFHSRTGLTPVVVYSQNSGAMAEAGAAMSVAVEALARGVQVVSPSESFHAKFLLWGEDDVVITSLNMGSATISPDLPMGELGVHLSGSQIASHLIDRLRGWWAFL